jgi:hypothetical protein
VDFRRPNDDAPRWVELDGEIVALLGHTSPLVELIDREIAAACKPRPLTKPMDAPGMRFERPAVETWEEP